MIQMLESRVATHVSLVIKNLKPKSKPLFIKALTCIFHPKAEFGEIVSNHLSQFFRQNCSYGNNLQNRLNTNSFYVYVEIGKHVGSKSDGSKNFFRNIWSSAKSMIHISNEFSYKCMNLEWIWSDRMANKKVVSKRFFLLVIGI